MTQPDPHPVLTARKWSRILTVFVILGLFVMLAIYMRTAMPKVPDEFEETRGERQDTIEQIEPDRFPEDDSRERDGILEKTFTDTDVPLDFIEEHPETEPQTDTAAAE